MITSKLNFGIVGAGRIAQAYAEAFETSDEARLVAVADTNADAARALAARLKCQSYDSHREMIAHVAALDAVVVCTPPVTHPEICLDLARCKIHTLCEKPFSVDSASATQMLEAARENEILLTMASKFRYSEDVVRARSLVASGTIGEVVLFENAFTSRVDMRSRWNSDPAISGGGVLIDNGTHSVDLMRYFLGPLADVQAVEGKRSQDLDTEETVRVSVRSVEGVMGSIDLSWSINKELPSYIQIYGSHGTISIGWRESKYRLASAREWTVFGAGYDKVKSFRAQIDNFARAIRGTEELRITPEDALASVCVIEAAYAALGGSRWTSVEKTNDRALCELLAVRQDVQGSRFSVPFRRPQPRADYD